MDIYKNKYIYKMPDGPAEFYFGIPTFTRYWLTLVFLTTFAFSFGFVNPTHLSYDISLIWNQFEVSYCF